ncbi:hypothetical protein GOV06_04850 [Candidatus Woesearchaeota archaeon]|nr:hypothetical protein [Candidatus Woesearchaeota archaeon]
MGESHKSLDAQLKVDGWKVEKIILNSEIAQKLALLAVEIAEGKKYDDVRVLPADLARQGEEWLLVEQAHLVYVKPSEEYIKKLKGSVSMLSAECRPFDDEHRSQLIRITDGEKSYFE